jgi:hypothetical protein
MCGTTSDRTFRYFERNKVCTMPNMHVATVEAWERPLAWLKASLRETLLTPELVKLADQTTVRKRKEPES